MTTEHRTRRIRELLLAMGPAIVALCLGAVAYDGVRRARESAALVAHTRDVIQRANGTLSTLQDAETGQRGFLLTGDPTYLAPYERAVAALHRDTTALRELTRDNAVQQRQLDTLESLARRKLAELASTIEARRASGLEDATRVVRTNEGKHTMDAIRRSLARLTVEERILLDARQDLEDARGRLVSTILLAGTLVAALLSWALSDRLLGLARTQAALVDELARRNLQLEQQGVELEMQSQQVQEQAAELEAQNEELRLATDELVRKASELETLNEALAERTGAAESARLAAESANQAKSSFLAMMSHELRTPLNAIAGYTQLMQIGVPEPAAATHRDYLDRIQQSQYHLLGVINSVLNFARIEAGTVTYDIHRIPVGALLDRAEALIAPQAAARGHRYVCIRCDRSVMVSADADKTTQILLNLLSNAIKFTPNGGVVSLSAEGRGDFVAMQVRDTGPGIPADKQDVIFDPFLQLDTSRTRTSEGTGLGLSISRNLARGMGGNLTVESVAGSGATFTLVLPRSH